MLEIQNSFRAYACGDGGGLSKFFSSFAAIRLSIIVDDFFPLGYSAKRFYLSVTHPTRRGISAMRNSASIFATCDGKRARVLARSSFFHREFAKIRAAWRGNKKKRKKSYYLLADNELERSRGKELSGKKVMTEKARNYRGGKKKVDTRF